MDRDLLRCRWGPTLYTNTLGLLPMLLAGVVTGEHYRLMAMLPSVYSPSTAGVVGLSCLVSVAMSYLVFRMTYLVSATSLAVIGIANKLLSVLGGALGPQRLGSRRPSSL